MVLAGAADIFRRSLEFGHPNAGTVHSRLGEALYKLALAQAKPELTAELLQAYEHLNLGAPTCPRCGRLSRQTRFYRPRFGALSTDSNKLQTIHTRADCTHVLLMFLTQLSAMVQRSRWSHATPATGCCEAAASG
jgi:hypothetical protein